LAVSASASRNNARARRLGSPLVLAWATAAVGLMSIVSAATPEMADRSRIVRSVLAQGIPGIARTLTLAFGLGLLWLARGLARRKRRAWQLAVALVVATAVAHLAKGLDVEEATGSLIVVVALWRARREFVAPGDPESVRPLLQVVIALAVAVPISMLRLYGTVAYSDRLDDAVLIAICALVLRALYLWLRPLAERARHVPEEWRRAEKLVREQGRDSLAYFALRHDKSAFFSASGKSFLAYRVVAGTALVAGDPIGDPAERKEMVAEFRRVAHARGWRVAIAGASAETLRDYAELGFKSIYLGDEAYVEPERFSLEGRHIRKVRQSVSRLEKAGYRFEALHPDEIGDELRDELLAVSEEWRGRWPERGFTMAMDALFAYPDTLVAFARNPFGKVGGFLQLVPTPASEGYSLASMRRRRDTPNGLMEFLIVRTIDWARAREVREVSLNFSVFAEYLGTDHGLLRVLLLRLDRLFQLERLHSFNRKFFPKWRRRYFCFERWSDLPAAGLAYLHAESLLTPPGPWAKSLDLASR
jgi:lysyl-tRNA synthetase, class II